MTQDFKSMVTIEDIYSIVPVVAARILQKVQAYRKVLATKATIGAEKNFRDDWVRGQVNHIRTHQPTVRPALHLTRDPFTQ